MKRNRWLRAVALVLCLSMLFCTEQPVNAQAEKTSEAVGEADQGNDAEHMETPGDTGQENDTGGKKDQKEKVVVKAVFCAGHNWWLHVNDAKGKVKWTVGDKKILKIVKKSNEECTVKALKDGKTYVRATAKNMAVTFKVTVKSGKAFIKAWSKQWAETYAADDMSDKEKLIFASSYLTTNGGFTYGNSSDPLVLLTKGYGTCVGGAKLLVYMCQAMGYKAKVRFAAKDKMSRYPQGVFFGEDHYNVEVTVNGKKYYIDGTPGSGCTYLSTSKKPIYYEIFGTRVY